MKWPKRIWRRHTKGWRMPAGAVYVGRGSKYGNPFHRLAVGGTISPRLAGWCFALWARHEAHPEFVALFWPRRIPQFPPWTRAELRRDLGGRDLACWCPLDQPCHAEVLLELANQGAER